MNNEALQANPYEGMKGDPQSADFDFWAQPPHVRQALAEDGFPVPKRPMPKEEPKKGKAKRKKGQSDHDLARAVVEEFPGPIAYVGGQFHTFEEATGWRVAHNAVKKACHAKLGRNANNVLVPIIESQMSLPLLDQEACAPIYWERIGGRWEGEWKPLWLKDTEILYTDGIYDVLTDEHRSTQGRIIWGPMVSLPWTTEDAVDPDISEIESFMTARMPDAEIRRHFQEVVGCILQPHVIFRGQIVLWGPPLCGKSTIMNMVGYAAGGAIGASRQKEADLAKSRWASNQLINKFVNLSDDSERVPQWTSFVKGYTSGMFTAEPKFGQPISVVSTAKLISTCNEMQDTGDSSGAMVDRLMPFKVENRIENSDSKYLSVQYWADLDRRVKVVEWLRRGLKRLRDRGRFDIPAIWEVQKSEAVAEGDVVEGWLRENIEEGSETDWLKTSQIIEKMPIGVAKSCGNKSLEMKIAQYLKRLYGSRRERVQREGERFYVFSNIRWT